MNIANYKNKYKKLFSLLPADIDEIRYLLVIDENYDDIDSDEFDGNDPEDFNYFIYINEALQDVLSKELLDLLAKNLSMHKDIIHLYKNDFDLYSVKTDLSDESSITNIVLESVEEIL